MENQLTIVVDDNQVIIDGVGLEINLAAFELPDNIRAVQWRNGQGEEEYNDGINRTITDLNAYTAIVAEHRRLKARIDSPPSPPTHSEQVDSYSARLDKQADTIRRRFLPGGDTVLTEYNRVAAQAHAFADAGYTGELPSGVADHVRRYQVTAQEAADRIIAMEQQYMQTLDAIRTLRFEGKTALEALPADADEATFLECLRQWSERLDQFRDKQ